MDQKDGIFEYVLFWHLFRKVELEAIKREYSRFPQLHTYFLVPNATPTINISENKSRKLVVNQRVKTHTHRDLISMAKV